jgi:phospholipase/lecithinase/hemolysin
MPVDALSSAPALPAFSGVIVFGDSTVDPGNDLKAAHFVESLPFIDLPNGAPTADKGYFEGRFSNGYNFADLVANKLLHEATQPTFPYGVTTALLGVPLPFVDRPDGNNLSFAYGGATVANAQAPPTLHDQLRIYRDFDVDPNALHLISIGANDVLSLVPTGGTPVTGAEAATRLAAIASDIAQEVAGLYARGVRHVVVADVPDVSVTPAYSGSQDEAMRRSLLAQYVRALDADLRNDLAALGLPAGASLLDYDFQNYTASAVANPQAYAFSNVTQALTSVQGHAPDPTGAGFLFFDKLHPTAQAHAQIASEILTQLASPGALHSWTAAAAIGAQAASAIAVGGSQAFAASLTAGRSYLIDALGVSTAAGTLADPVVRVLDGAGAVVAQADDGGIGLDSHLQFTAAASGDYTVEVAGVGVTAGGFRLQAGDAAGSNLLLSGLLRGSNVTVQGGDTNDTIAAVAGTNVLLGGAGADSLLGGAGFDRINGNQGDDVIVGASQLGDWLLGGQGNDLINASGSSGNNIVNGNLGNDTITAGAGPDIARGGQGDDLVRGGGGADWLSGDLGHNTLTGGTGADTFHAGAGVDLVTDFDPAAGDRVQLDLGATYSVSQSGADTVISLGASGQMTLAGVLSTSLPDGWIFAA